MPVFSSPDVRGQASVDVAIGDLEPAPETRSFSDKEKHDHEMHQPIGRL